jgi:transposase
MSNSSASVQDVAAWIGLDWADHKHALSLQAADGSAVEHYQVERGQLAEWIAQLQARWPGQTIALALEQSRGPVWYTLIAYAFLRLYPINPKSLARFRETFAPSGSKNDPQDADLLREMIQKHADRFRPWQADTPQTRQLQLLVEYRRQSVDERTGLMNQATSLLKCYYPVALECAGGLDTVQACEFLRRWPTLEALQKAPASRLRTFYQRHGCRRSELIEQRLEIIRQAHPLTTDPALVASLSQRLRTVVSQLQALIPAVKEFDDQIATLFAAHPDRAIMESFPAAGAVMAPRLAAAFGTDRSRFDGAREIQKLSGIAPVTKKSGQSCWVHRRWACPKFLLQTFHEYARLSRQQSVWAEAFYQRKRAEGKKHHAAIRALAYQWIRIIYRCWQDHTCYDEARYQEARRLRQMRGLKVACGTLPVTGLSGKDRSDLVPVSTLLPTVLDELMKPTGCGKPVQDRLRP